MIPAESYACFLTEAQDLLQLIEQDLLSLKDDRTPAKVHNLMRSAHTLKGAAASVELDTIQHVAHALEDIFKALYNPEIKIDAEVETLLFQAYECLRLPLMAEFTGGTVDEADILDRTASVIAQLQDKLGDCFDREAPLPTSAELGFDIVKSMFEMGVNQRLEALEAVLKQANLPTIATTLKTTAEVFIGLAESLELPGFAAIAQTTLMALENHPDRVMAIAKLALNDFRQGQLTVLEGDRTQGGSPSPQWDQFQITIASTVPEEALQTEFSDSFFSSLDLPNETNSESIQQEANPELLAEIELELNHLFEDTASLHLNNTDSIDRNSPQDDAIVDLKLTEIPEVESDRWSERSRSRTAIAPTVRVQIEQLERLNYLAGEMLIHQNQQISYDDQLRLHFQTFLQELREHQRRISELQDWSDRLLVSNGTWGIEKPNPTDSRLSTVFDPLEMDHYSDLHSLLQSTLDQAGKLEAIAEEVEQFNRQARRTRFSQQHLLAEMRDDLTTARMQALGELLNRLPPVLRQLATAYSKPIDVVIEGTDVLVDKAIAEKLYDPLLHLVRNAFDHGIESPEVRKACSKPEVGRIEIRAYQQGNCTVIEVKDDGQGINLQQIAARAIDLQLLTPHQVEQASEKQLLDLLFEPGFSTATQISELSGRGVGLNVVKTQLQALKGQISVTSTPQQGTIVALYLPMPLTITRLLICQANGLTYALPVDRIEQITQPRPEQFQLFANQKLSLDWKQGKENRWIPIHRLSELVLYPQSNPLRTWHSNDSENVSDSLIPSRFNAPIVPDSPVLLLRTASGLEGLVVDQVFGEQELVIRPMGETIAPAPYIYGCCILANSRLALAIDPVILIQSTIADQVVSDHSISSTATLSPANLPTSAIDRGSGMLLPQSNTVNLKALLIVDDSLTLRQTLTRTLKQAGYQVVQAQDGIEALEKLRQQQASNIALIICDIEMPRLNGFGFLSHFRQDHSFSKIPVVMLTSRTGDKHRQLALELGASAYLTKPYVETDLLSTVTTMLNHHA